MRLKDKVALVPRASEGDVGWAIAEALAGEKSR